MVDRFCLLIMMLFQHKFFMKFGALITYLVFFFCIHKILYIGNDIRKQTNGDSTSLNISIPPKELVQPLNDYYITLPKKYEDSFQELERHFQNLNLDYQLNDYDEIKNLHVVIKPDRVKETFSDLIIFNIQENKSYQANIIKSIINYFINFKSQQFGKNIIILIQQNKYRQNGQNIQKFLNDYYSQDEKSQKQFLRGGQIMFSFALDIEDLNFNTVQIKHLSFNDKRQNMDYMYIFSKAIKTNGIKEIYPRSKFGNNLQDDLNKLKNQYFNNIKDFSFSGVFNWIPEILEENSHDPHPYLYDYGVFSVTLKFKQIKQVQQINDPINNFFTTFVTYWRVITIQEKIGRYVSAYYYYYYGQCKFVDMGSIVLPLILAPLFGGFYQSIENQKMEYENIQIKDSIKLVIILLFEVLFLSGIIFQNAQYLVYQIALFSSTLILFKLIFKNQKQAKYILKNYILNYIYICQFAFILLHIVISFCMFPLYLFQFTKPIIPQNIMYFYNFRSKSIYMIIITYLLYQFKEFDYQDFLQSRIDLHLNTGNIVFPILCLVLYPIGKGILSIFIL